VPFVQIFKVRVKPVSVLHPFSHLSFRLFFWFGLIRRKLTLTRTRVENALPIWCRERAFKRKLPFVETVRRMLLREVLPYLKRALTLVDVEILFVGRIGVRRFSQGA
jgi:hypothetical protein